MTLHHCPVLLFYDVMYQNGDGEVSALDAHKTTILSKRPKSESIFINEEKLLASELDRDGNWRMRV